MEGNELGPIVGPSERTVVGTFDPSIDGFDDGSKLEKVLGCSDPFTDGKEDPSNDG